MFEVPCELFLFLILVEPAKELVWPSMAGKAALPPPDFYM